MDTLISRQREVQPSHVTVIFKDLHIFINAGVGPTSRRVTIELTEEQRKQLAPLQVGQDRNGPVFEMIDACFTEAKLAEGD